MEKVILVVLGENPERNALDFAGYLSGLGRVRLEGIFLEDTAYEEKAVQKRTFGMPYVESIVAQDFPDYREKKEKTERNMRTFLAICEEKGIVASAQRLLLCNAANIIEVSRFADMIIVDASVSCPDGEDEPPPYLRQLLESAYCPIMIAPVLHAPVEEVVFCYDGGASAIFAMKQFSYLMPEFNDLKGTVVRVNQGNSEALPEEKRMLMMWMSRRYSYVDYATLSGQTEEALFAYMLRKQHALIVMGAYGRNMISRFFRRSHSDLLIKSLAFPLFITHY